MRNREAAASRADIQTTCVRRGDTYAFLIDGRQRLRSTLPMGSLTVGSILGLLAAIVTVVGGAISIWSHYRPRREAKILNPLNGSQVHGRYVELRGIVPRQKSGHEYWIAIQPSDCRGTGDWWPQAAPLTFHANDVWVLQRARLGRGGALGEDEDAGKTYTIQLLEIPPESRSTFHEAAQRDERLRIPPTCNHLHGIEVIRARTDG